MSPAIVSWTIMPIDVILLMTEATSPDHVQEKEKTVVNKRSMCPLYKWKAIAIAMRNLRKGS
jgi:hypothetical protein